VAAAAAAVVEEENKPVAAETETEEQPKKEEEEEEQPKKEEEEKDKDQKPKKKKLGKTMETVGKRHRKLLKDNIKGVTKGSIKRMARRGGVKRISNLTYDEVRGQLKSFLQDVVRDSVTYMEHGKRRTVTPVDVVHGLRRRGITLYGFSG